MFEDEVVRQPCDEVSQKTSITTGGGDDQLDRDLTRHEWNCNMSTQKRR